MHVARVALEKLHLEKGSKRKYRGSNNTPFHFLCTSIHFQALPFTAEEVIIFHFTSSVYFHSLQEGESESGGEKEVEVKKVIVDGGNARATTPEQEAGSRFRF